MSTEKKKAAPAARPLILEIEDAKANICQEVNAALRKGLPCYLVKDILEGLLSQIREGAKAELEAARAQEVARAESEKKEETE